VILIGFVLICVDFLIFSLLSLTHSLTHMYIYIFQEDDTF
jgi:hypothetical protein